MTVFIQPPPVGVRLGDERLVQLTPAAGAKVEQLMGREVEARYLRIKIKGGGCNGLAYKLLFVREVSKGDILVRSQGVEVLVDPRSALYLRGIHLDYSDALVSGGFKFSNPNATSSCSCGESFSI